MAYNSTKEYLNIVDRLTHDYNIPKNITDPLLGYLKSIYRSELEDRLSAPMLWIGMYIALASLVCIFAMVADLMHGLLNRQLWFPSKYFRINSAFLTVIAVATKLPVDLTGLMPGYVDQVAKLGSMAFMCTIMANLLPCLATMESNDILSNTISLCVVVITLVVNVCIQMQTGAVSISNHKEDPRIIQLTSPTHISANPNSVLPFIYVILLVVFLIIHICSSLGILRSVQIIEDKYQVVQNEALENIKPSSGEMVTVETLEKQMGNHWIMAESGKNLIFTKICFHTTSASGVICLLVTILHTLTMFWTIQDIFTMEWDSDFGWSMMLKYCDSDYGWSMIVIFIVQSMGIVIGTIAPVSRCFATLSFKVSYKIISKHFKVFKVERYWTQKLYGWKYASIRLPFRSRNLELVIESLQRLILYICIGLQNGVMVVCKVIALIPFLCMICFLYCFRCMKWLMGKKSQKLEENNDLSHNVLQLEDEMELGERYLEGLSKPVNQFIHKGAKSQPINLKNLIQKKSTSCFEGVKQFDNIDDHDVPCVDCWRLPVVTLTTIILSLPKIGMEEVDILLESVREGLEFVMVVEKSLNAKDRYLSFQKAATDLWMEIRFDKKWLGNQLQNHAFHAYTAEQIVEWFRDMAHNIIGSEDRSKDYIGDENDDLRHRSICANSMYRITDSILRNCHTNIDVTVSQKELFDSLSSMIADIIAACLTNLPQAIIMKCYTSVIKERKANVHDAAHILGETREIIETLQGHHIPNMDPSDLPFIKKWRAYLRSP